MESSKLLTKFMPTLQLLSKVKSSAKLNLILTEFSKDTGFARLMSEFAHNLFQRKIPVQERMRRRLKKHKQVLVKVASCKKKTRAKYIKQSGGWLNIAIPALFALLDSLQ